MEFKDKLKKLRAEKGISQQALADRIYVSRSAVAKWENGLGYPSQDSIDALTAYFGVDENYFRTEEPETVIAGKNRHIRWLRHILAAVAAVLVIVLIVMGYHRFSTVRATDMEGLAKQAEAYFGHGGLSVVKTAQRGNYLAALCVDPDNKWCMCVYERDPLFDDRWNASGGKPSLDAGELRSWNYGSPQKEAVLIFCGGELPEEIKWYTFQNAGISYTCPVEDNMVLDIFIILDSWNNSGSPTPLDENQQPLG